MFCQFKNESMDQNENISNLSLVENLNSSHKKILIWN